MLAVFKRELFSFLHSQMAYIIIGVFLTACGLLFWVFPDTSILSYGYAEMEGFFSLVPYLFMFLIPAVAMRTFAEERKEGTYVLLATRPLTDWQIIGGKYLACLLIVLFAILPTVIYYFSLYQLGLPKGNIDSGAVIGSYIGLFLLGSAFVSIGVFASSLVKNQMIAFAIATLLCFFTFSGFDSISRITFFEPLNTEIQNLGISEHYQSISRGVLDSRDLVYFTTFVFLFLAATKIILGRRTW
jgi:ABC-2 type transport system permease protein